MAAPILATKLYISPPRARVVLRTRLNERLNEGLSGRLTLISASAGFGKTTLVSSWIYDLRLTSDDFQSDAAGAAKTANRVAWLSLDEGDSDPARFLIYLLAALQTVVPNIGEAELAALQSPQQPPTESILTALLNVITTISDSIILVLDDYHLVDAGPVEGSTSVTWRVKRVPWW